MERIEVEIVGITPLLMNRFHEELDGTRSPKEKPTPHDDAQERLYQNDAGIYFPAENLRQSIVAAASRHKIGRRSATTDVAAAVYIEPFALDLSGDWEVDSRPVVIPATKGRVMRHRPLFRQWTLQFALLFDAKLLDEKLLRRIVDDAGNYVGIGDFRPARKGPHGRFRVDSWHVAR